MYSTYFSWSEPKVKFALHRKSSLHPQIAIFLRLTLWIITQWLVRKAMRIIMTWAHPPAGTLLGRDYILPSPQKAPWLLLEVFHGTVWWALRAFMFLLPAFLMYHLAIFSFPKISLRITLCSNISPLCWLRLPLEVWETVIPMSLWPKCGHRPYSDYLEHTRGQA